MGAALAAAIVTAVAVGALFVIPLRVQKRKLAALESVEEKLVEQKRLNALAAETVRLTRSPGLRVIEMLPRAAAPTTAAPAPALATRPAVWARLLLDPGTGRYQFYAGGLPRLAVGQTYELWAAAAAGGATQLAAADADFFGEVQIQGSLTAGEVTSAWVTRHDGNAPDTEQSRELLRSR